MVTAKVLKNKDPFSGQVYKGLKIGNEEIVENVHIDQSLTYIDLFGFPNQTFNSVCFEFYEDEKELDIYSDKRFNPYL